MYLRAREGDLDLPLHRRARHERALERNVGTTCIDVKEGQAMVMPVAIHTGNHKEPAHSHHQ